MAAPLGSRMSRAVVGAVGAIALAGLLVLSSLAQSPKADADQQKAVPSVEKKTEPTDAEDSDDGAMIDPLGPNSACYVCHTTFVWEELATVHLPEKITCIECHGLSAAHANDEDIGATPPDIIFKREKIDASCVECHEEHDVSARDVIERFIDRKPPSSPPVCTDCHGTHKIERPEEEEAEEKEKEVATSAQPAPAAAPQ